MLRSLRRNSSLSSRLAFSLLSGVLVSAIGCGGEKGPPTTGSVHGSVTSNGASVKAGQIVFVNADPKAPKPNTLTSDFQDGKYALGSLATGKYKVYLMQPNDAEGKPKPADDIPKKYRTADTSDLTAEINVGENTKDFDLKE